MRIAVLADIHGNLPALRAVLAEIDRAPVDAIVVSGDVVGGPMVAEVLGLISVRPEPVHWVSGNSEREAVAAYDGEHMADDPPGRAASWSAKALSKRWRDQLASWPISLALDGVRFCHGSPRRDDEILTRTTPTEVVAQALAGVAERLVVGGHTHQQMIQSVHAEGVADRSGRPRLGERVLRARRRPGGGSRRAAKPRTRLELPQSESGGQ